MKNSIQNTVLYSAGIIVVLLISSFTLKQVIQAKETKPINSGFAVLELFTSQGCSSCPPADAVLGKYALEDNPNIIPLAFHVDYWNGLGWKDPFSKAAFSNRQREYAQQMNSESTYTPQLIINGKYDVLGSDESAIKNKIQQELATSKSATIQIKEVKINGNLLNVEYYLEKPSANSVVNIALVKKKELTTIKRGENSGLKLTNYNIVYDFKTVSSLSNLCSLEFKEEWLPSDYFIVAYLQNSKTSEVITATKSEIK